MAAVMHQQNYIETSANNIIKFCKDDNVKTKYKKVSNKHKGKSSTVYAFKTEEDLSKIFSVFCRLIICAYASEHAHYEKSLIWLSWVL